MRYLEELVKAMHGLSGLRDSSCSGGRRGNLWFVSKKVERTFSFGIKESFIAWLHGKSTTVKNYSFFH